MQRFAITSVVVLAVLGGLFFVKPRTGVGATVPDFTLPDARGRAVSLSDYRGQVVVLDFWASWCPPCRAAIPAMDRLHTRYRDRGVVVLGINVNDNKDPGEFMLSMGASYPTLLRGEAVADDFRVRGIPTIIVVGVDGKVLYRDSGWSGAKEAQIADVIERELGRIGA